MIQINGHRDSRQIPETLNRIHIFMEPKSVCHMQRMQWIERKFQFEIPVGWLPNVMARLSGTAPRLSELTSGLSDDLLVYQPGEKWSIKEHIGHLSDLEELHEGRLQDFRDRKALLRAADMKNVATEAANHNASTIDQLIKAFVLRRKAFLEALDSLDDATQEFVSLHPRLKVPMKPVDMATFTAEHDDHHIASIVEIIETYKT